MPKFLTVAHTTDEEEADECVRSLQANSSESDDSSGEAPVWRSQKFMKGVGLSLVVAALIGTALVMRGSSAPSTKSAHHLLESPEFHDAVRARVLISAGRNGQTGLDMKEVDREIADSLSKVLNKLEKDFPSVYEQLKTVLPEDQKKSLVKLLGRMHDERLKKLGQKAIGVIVQNALAGPKGIRQRLVEEFRPELPELKKLYNDVVPQPIRAAKQLWYESNKKSAVDTEQEVDGGWEFLTHPKSINIMKTFERPSNQSSSYQVAERRLQQLEQPLSVKLGVGITGFVLDSVNTLIIELSQIIPFKMPWWGWLLTLLPGVSLGTTSCIISPIEKFYSDFWCVDFLMFTGLQALEVTINSAWTDMVSGKAPTPAPAATPAPAR